MAVSASIGSGLDRAEARAQLLREVADARAFRQAAARQHRTEQQFRVFRAARVAEQDRTRVQRGRALGVQAQRALDASFRLFRPATQCGDQRQSTVRIGEVVVDFEGLLVAVFGRVDVAFQQLGPGQRMPVAASIPN